MAGGEWVKVDLTGHLGDWHQVSGRWALAAGVLNPVGTQGEGLLVLPARLGANFEVRGKVDVDVKAPCGNTLGVAFGYSDRDREGGDWRMCEFWQDETGPGVTATLLDGFRASKAPKVPLALEPANTFLVQGWNNQVSYYVNGKPVLEEYPYVENSNAKDTKAEIRQIGFGSNTFCAKSTVKIHDVEIRRLTARPIPPEPPAVAVKVTPVPKPSRGKRRGLSRRKMGVQGRD